MKNLLVVLALMAISLGASAAGLLGANDEGASGGEAQPKVSQEAVIEGTACPGVGATGFTESGLLLSCQSGAGGQLTWASSNQPNLVGGYVTTLRHGTGSLSCQYPNPVTGNCSCNSTAGGSYTSIATSTYTDTTVYGTVLTYSAYLCVKTVKVFGQTLMNCSIGVECSCPTGKPVAYTLFKSGLVRGIYMCL